MQFVERTTIERMNTESWEGEQFQIVYQRQKEVSLQSIIWKFE